jgi:DNA polymerase-3 subunit alpha
MAALLSGDMDARNFKKKDSLVEHLEDCRRMGLEVTPPDVNKSSADFAVADGKIVFALAAIKGCGGAAGEAIAQARKTGGPFRSLFDVCERCDPSVLNRTAIESLVKAGAFDQLHANRASLWHSLDRAVQAGASRLADMRAGQKGLFDDDDADESTKLADTSLVQTSDWSDKERLANEKEVLGFYLTSHPLAEHREVLATHCSHTTTGLAGVAQRTEVTMGGMLSSIKFSQTKNPRQGQSNTKYAMFDLEDLDGIVRCIVWPEEFAKFGQLVQGDAIFAVRGTIDRRAGSDEANLIVNELIPLEELRRRGTKGVVVRVHEEAHGIEVLQQLRDLIADFPGNAELQLLLNLADGSRLYIKSDSLRIEVNAELRERIEGLLGPGNLRAITAPAQSSPPTRAEYSSQRAMATTP